MSLPPSNNYQSTAASKDINQTIVNALTAKNFNETLTIIVNQCRQLSDANQVTLSYAPDGDFNNTIQAHSFSEKYKEYNPLDLQLLNGEIFRDLQRANKSRRKTQKELVAHSIWKNKEIFKDHSCLKHPQVCGYLITPIRAIDNSIIGALLFSDKITGDFTLRDTKRIEQLAGVIARAFDLQMHQEKIDQLLKSLTKQQRLLEDQKQELKKRATDISYLSKHDELTGLDNRSALKEKLQWSISMAELNHQILAVVMLDLDHFKLVNDSLGHQAGDKILITIGTRLINSVRQADIVARHGGDEFVLVLNDQSSAAATLNLLQRTLEDIQQPIQYANQEINVTCSIGFSLFPKDGQDAETLLKHADTALHQTKKDSRGQFSFFRPEMQKELQERVSLETELRHAVQQNEFELHYQPQVDMNSGNIIGLEALIRWQHPRLGVIPPAQFIPLAEEIGLISQIGEWVLKTACQQNKSWQNEGHSKVTVAVNFSAKQLMQTNIVQLVNNVLSESGLEARYLVIEITESLSMTDPETTITIMQALKTLGVKISIDDFGTGYSNLSYLKRFPIDEIKIDRAFVKDITTDPHDLAITKTIIAIAHCLDLKVIAEGIETQSQLALLIQQKCDMMQGYYFSRPLTAESCSQLLVENPSIKLDEIRQNKYQRSLLIVDDEKRILSSIKRLLRPLKLNIFEAENAEAALELMALHKIDVILCDIMMPGMDGIEFFSRIHQMYPETTRIILSGQTNFNVATDAINRGAIYKFLTKPWKNDKLCSEIEAAFRHHEASFEQRNESVE
ncbi:EAL domain-containing protein [Aliikangiella coralliicola]|nr:EAL domain-containing protein [Aliikangiella coralliicola]